MYTFVFVCVFSCAYVFICGVEGRGGACVCPCVYAHVCVSTTVSTNESVCIQLYLSFVSVYPCEYVRIPFATARARIPARGEGGGGEGGGGGVCVRRLLGSATGCCNLNQPGLTEWTTSPSRECLCWVSTWQQFVSMGN